MQGHFNPHHHHLHQQLAALLSAAASSSADSSTTTAAASSSSSSSSLLVSASGGGNGSEELSSSASSRVLALESLRRTIVYPPNSLLLSQSAPFLSQGLSQLLSDKSYPVRRAAAVAYGSLCAVLASTSVASNGLQNQFIASGMIDHFIAWSLSQFRDTGARNGSAELALESLREFLNTGNAGSIECYAPGILKACQELLEDERTSPSFLHLLLSLLALISVKFSHCFQLHFVDIVDVLLGWAFLPDLSESDRCIITDSFLQFQKHWLSNLSFSLGLLSKFLGDMEILIQDATLEFMEQYGRLLALFSCFATVLQVTASGMLEMNLLEQISVPIENMAPRFLRFVSMFGSKFGWSKWIRLSWRCLIVLADILQEKFSNFYLLTIDILFQSLKEVSSSQLVDLLKTNMQLLSLQKLGLHPSAAQTLLQFQSPLSQLRLHPNHLIVAMSASTYLFLLRHDCDSVVSQSVTSLFTELELLKGTLVRIHQLGADFDVLQAEDEMDDQLKPDLISCKHYSETDLISLVKFDLKMLLCSISCGAVESSPDQSNIDNSRRYERGMKLTSFILEKLDPFDFPIHASSELQVHVIRTLQKLSEVEFLTRLTGSRKSSKYASGILEDENQRSLVTQSVNSLLTTEYLRKYSICITKALDVSSPLKVKLEALNWVLKFGRMVIDMDMDWDLIGSSHEPSSDASISGNLLFSILDAAHDREISVRFHVSSVLGVLFEARLIYPGHFCFVSEVSLDKLSDPDVSIRNAYIRVLSVALPLSIYSCSSVENRGRFFKLGPATVGNRYHLKWKKILALKQLPLKLHSHQLVSILSYISQRWKVPLSSWIQRLVFNCLGKREVSAGLHEAAREHNSYGILKDPEIQRTVLEKLCPVNNLAAIWWSIHESARHCISLRLRTNLGGPAQTFAALERMLLDIPNVLQLDTEQSEGKYIGSSNFHLLPMRLLLEFVEALKKNVYNAYEGSLVLPSPNRQSSLFFKANKKVCEEWFSRICEPLTNAGLALHCHDATFHYCALRLQDLRTLVVTTFKEKPRGALENFHNLRQKLAADVLKILRHASLALCRSCEPEALVGLQKWAAITFPFLFVDDNLVSQSASEGCRHLSWMTGLVYQARGHYEKAAAHFSHLLQSEEALSSMGSDGIQFVIARVIESYTSLSDWKSLEIWLTELQALRSMHAGKAYSGALTAAGNELNAVHALARFDEGDILAAWGYLDLTPKSSNELTLDSRMALERSEQMLLRSMLQKDGSTDKALEDLEKAKLMLEETFSAAPLDGLTEAAACATQLHCIFAFEEGLRSDDLHEARQLPTTISSFRQVLHSTVSSTRQDCSLWLKVLRVYRTVQPTSLVTPLLCGKILNLARKQENFSLANRMNKYLKDHVLRYSYVEHAGILSLNLQYESILLKHSEGKHEEALVDLWSMVHPAFLSSNVGSSEIGAVLKAKACLKLSTWLRRESSNVSLRKVLHTICEDFSVSDAFCGSFASDSFSLDDVNLTSVANWNVILEEIVGISTKVSCNLCPTMGKTWLSYASWCFNQAKGSLPVRGSILQSCSLSPVLNPEVLPDIFQLTKEELSKVKAIITDICHGNRYVLLKHDPGELDSNSHSRYEALVNSLVQQTVYLMQAAAGAPGLEESDCECPSSALSSQLQVLFLCLDGGMKKSDIMGSLDELVSIWWSLRKRRVSLLGYAAQGYFNYLTHSASKQQDSFCDSIYPDVGKEKATSCSLRAMLYILHILVNYGVELRGTLECGFATVPPLPWQEITPQLFARLSSHPKETVRKQLEGLLMMLAKLSPWSIVYPLLVDINAYDGPPPEELKRILDYLGKINQKLIQDVQLVVNCLGSITVLLEEQWLSTLQDLHTDVMRRINMLKEEAARIAENTTLSHTEKSKINAAKYSAMMAPIIVALERRLASTSREPETPHEIWFCKEYGEQLRAAILAFKAPPRSAAALTDVWRPFDAIAASLATNQRKSSIYLGEVAPRLALLSSSDVPMPGLEKHISMLDSSGTSNADVQGIITISSFCNHITVLSTKTKPKKLVLMGSDGQKYTYLLKGREDLRLDARIMQLLQAINSFLNSRTDTCSQSLGIRYYSVTPISGRAGLIQWVDNVTSIYSVYKSWQIRAQQAQLSANGVSNTPSSVPPVPRPSDMFYGKIIPALKEKGIRRVISRRDWPHEVKRKVLLDLMKDTPRHILWQELWCASEGFRGFSSKTKRFSGSVAAMSIVGHILGLGDRHLDNILMDFFNGDVIHIDYNICFDKGRRLKIPEIVPFRLTQTIETALGLTGVEGTFRANCEAVIDILRKNKDIVLMLLGVFVWDPLVEWTRDSHDEAAIGGEEKKGMELAVSLSLFASRFQEIRIPLQEHHDLLVSTLPAAESALKKFLDVLNQYDVISDTFYHADKERSSLIQQETSARLIVVETTSVSEKSRASFEVQAHEFAQAKGVATERSQEAAMWVDQHGGILDSLRSGAVLDAQTYIKLGNMVEALSLTSAVLVSGVPLTIVPEPTQAHCYDLDREVGHLIVELDDGLSCAIEALNEYAIALQRVLPLNYITSSPVSSWAQVLQLSVNDLSTDRLTLARRQAADLIAKAQGEGLDSVQQRHQDLCQNVDRYTMEIEKVENECSELMSSIGADTESKSKERLLSAFTRYIQSVDYLSKEDDLSITHTGPQKHDWTKGSRMFGSHDEKRVRVLSVLRLAANEFYTEIKVKVLNVSNSSLGRIGWQTGDACAPSDSWNSFREFEEQIEKCGLVAGFVSEAQEMASMDISSSSVSEDNAVHLYARNWASVFQASLHACKYLIQQMTEVAIPEIVRSIISYNSDIMDAFDSLSQIRGSIDTALENLVEVELERASLVDLEKNYFVKVESITEQQLALEQAAVKGRDHLSWEEAEELATQEEACRAQLHQLHQTWNQKDMRRTSLTRIESNIRTSLVSSEQYFSSLISNEEDGELHIRRSKSLLAALVKPFSELDSIDQMLPSYGSLPSYSNEPSPSLSDLLVSGSQLSECLWGLVNLLKDHTFFIWKVGILDTVLDSCIHDISSSVDNNFGLDHIYNDLKKKLNIQLQGFVVQYLKKRIVPALVAQIEEENENLQKMIETRRDVVYDQIKGDSGATRRVQLMLEEYCNAHETARAARSAISVMKRQRSELTEALCKTIFEIVQMEWLYDTSLPRLLETKVLPKNILNDDNFSSLILNLSRSKLLEKIQSSMSSVGRSLEYLQACERTSVAAEGQLERAMGWACGGPNTAGMGNTSVKNSGIPSEFHDHLSRRRQILWTAQEQASNITKMCKSVMEFEASRDGLFRMPGEKSSGRPSGDGRTWQQTYLNALTRLDVSYHSFICAEQEWKLAKNNMDAAASGLFSATNELHVASAKAKSASGDLQDILAAMRDCAYEASESLSAYSRVSKGHTALTSECGSMLEEVMAIAEGLPDVYSLGKEAAAAHHALMEDLSKVNMTLLPLEVSLSSDVVAIADAIPKEREINTDVPPIHGQALYKSYCFRLREACQSLTPLVPSVVYSVKELHSMLTKLARSSSMHAGNLHKALEGLGDSQEARSHDLGFSNSKFSNELLFDNKEKGLFGDNGGGINESAPSDHFALQDEEWISPPEHTYTSSQDSSSTSAEASISETCDLVEHLHLDVKSADCYSHLSITNADGLETMYNENSQPEVTNVEVNANNYGVSVLSDPSERTQSLPYAMPVCNDSIANVKQKSSVDAEALNSKNAIFSSEVVKEHGASNDGPSYLDTASHIRKGKNAYALSVLRQVELKVDGREIDSSRSISISEQVDLLLKQATSLDNLCNMYEGWTPWI